MSEAFEAAFSRLPQAQRTQRSAAWQAFRETGFPRKNTEDWRYTDLSALAQASYTPAPLTHPELRGLTGFETLAIVNGFVAEGSLALVMPMETAPLRSGIGALNAALSSDGLNLLVPARQTQAPLYLLTWFGGPERGMAHVRHRIVLAEGASATVVWHEDVGRPAGDSAGVDFFTTQVLDIEMGPNSELTLYRLQQPGAKARVITRVDALLRRDARFTCVGVHGGGALTRNDINVSLDGAGSRAELHGILAPGSGQHLDVHTRLDHRAAHGTSREAFRALVPAGAKCSFNGKVVVHRDAQKTDSEQHIDSLLLSPGAEINAKPELQIDADDVKCAHGATVGQLDDDALYYLRARGLPADVARAALVRAFAAHVTDLVAPGAARDLLNAALP